MKNVVASFIIFFIMVGVMLFSLNYLNKVCSAIAKESDRLEELILNDEWDTASEVTNKMLEHWKQHSEIMPMFVNHAEVDILHNELLRLTQYVTVKNKDESLASTHVVKFYIENIKSLQKINMENLF